MQQPVIKGILDDIDKAHRRIFAPIDFDELNSRAIKTKQWLNLGIFSDADRRLIAKEIGQCFAEIRRLRFRQEKAKAERQAKANELAAALQKEIAEVNAEASANPGSQESWHALADMDGRIRENWNFLTDSQRQALRQAVEAGFQKIKAARAA